MTTTKVASPGDELDPIGVSDVLNAVRRYLTERFPIFSQGGTVLSAFVCSYLLYGQAYGRQTFGWPTIVGAVSVVLLTLVRRLIDDVEDLRGDILIGRVPSGDRGRRHMRGLILGAVTVTGLIAALNATCGLALAAIGVAIAIWFAVATTLKHTALAQSSRAVFYTINETCPVAGLLYPYAAWCAVAGSRLPTMTVVATVGLFWTTWEFWMFTRKVGREGWPPWFLTFGQTRAALMAFLLLSATFSGLVYRYVGLPAGYLVYAVGVSLAFAIVILRWWARLPAHEPERVTASWGGLSFAIAVEAGVLVAILAAGL